MATTTFDYWHGGRPLARPESPGQFDYWFGGRPLLSVAAPGQYLPIVQPFVRVVIRAAP